MIAYLCILRSIYYFGMWDYYFICDFSDFHLNVFIWKAIKIKLEIIILSRASNGAIKELVLYKKMENKIIK